MARDSLMDFFNGRQMVVPPWKVLHGYNVGCNCADAVKMVRSMVSGWGVRDGLQTALVYRRAALARRELGMVVDKRIYHERVGHGSTTLGQNLYCLLV